jgi:hypothetical protein
MPKRVRAWQRRWASGSAASAAAAELFRKHRRQKAGSCARLFCAPFQGEENNLDGASQERAKRFSQAKREAVLPGIG